MKRIFAILVAVLLTANLRAQSPEKMSYQAVIRNTGNALVVSQSVGMRISILQGSATGTAVYEETQTPGTNANGLVSIEIGAGTIVSGDFSAIDWANGPYFIKTETDPTGGASYTITGTSQLLSVPYAMHAKTAETVTGSITETDPIFGLSVASAITATDTANWNNTSHDLYLGKDTLGGIVYYIYMGSDGQQHGLIVSKTETTAVWQNTGVHTYGSLTWDGAVNTKLLTNSPAKDWITTNFSSVWYLPSIDELSILWHNRFHLNKVLDGLGVYLLSNSAAYWSSTEISGENAFILIFHYGYVSEDNKTKAFNVRAVREF